MHLQVANLSVLWRFRSPVPFVPDPVRDALRRVYPKDAAARLTRVDGTEGGGVVLALKANNDPSKATACVYDPATGDVQVRGSLLDDVLKMYDKASVALERHVPELGSKLLFSEALFEGWLASKRHPLTRLRTVMGPEVAGKWGKAVLSTEAKPFGLRICNADPFPPTEPINKIACSRLAA
jgi:hypothetical protein